MSLRQRLSFQSLSSARTLGTNARFFLLATVANGFVLSSWSLFFNFFILRRGFDKEFLGLANTLPSVSAILVTLPLGILVDRIGRKPGMLIGLFISTLTLGLQVLVVSPGLLLGMAFLNGIGNMLYIICQGPYIMEVSDERNRAMLFSLNFGLSILAGAFGNLAAGQLPALFNSLFSVPQDTSASYQAVLLVSVAISSLALIPTLLLKERPRESSLSRRNAFSQLRSVLRPTTFKLMLPNIFIGFAAPLIIPYLNVFFAENHGLTDQNLGVLFSLYALLIGIATLLSPLMADLLRSKIRTVVITEGSSVFFLLLLGFTPLRWLAQFSYLARGVLMNMSAPLYQTYALERIAPEEQGAANSLLNLSWQFGWATCPYISGIVQQRYGFPPLFIASSILFAVAVALVWIFFHGREERPVFNLAPTSQD